MAASFLRPLLAALFLAPALAAAAAPFELHAPTPDSAWMRAETPLEQFVQPTAAGETASGCFGCVRSGGAQFHEGLDLKPTQRDARGEAADPVFAIADGVVRHVNRRAGESSYGRYLVVEHTGATPAFLSLYAHLASVPAEIRVGTPVKGGQTLARMGRSAGGYNIPPERAHLHLELAVMLDARNFQGWYDWKKFGSKNQHGPWNGMNLIGFDPLEFFRQHRAGQVGDVRDYLSRQPCAVRVRIASATTPHFLSRYPSLRAGALGDLETPGGWEVDFTWYGLPFAWRPLSRAEAAGLSAGRAKIVSVDGQALRKHRCRKLVKNRAGEWVPGEDLETILQLLFGLRR